MCARIPLRRGRRRVPGARPRPRRRQGALQVFLSGRRSARETRTAAPTIPHASSTCVTRPTPAVDDDERSKEDQASMSDQSASKAPGGFVWTTTRVEVKEVSHEMLQGVARVSGGSRSFTRRLAALALWGATLALSGGASASEPFPELIAEHLDMPCVPPCTICHQTLSGQTGQSRPASRLRSMGARSPWRRRPLQHPDSRIRRGAPWCMSLA